VADYLPPQYEYIYRGSVQNSTFKLRDVFRIFQDYIIFTAKTRLNAQGIVVNTSLGLGGFIRDAIFLQLVSNRIKKIVFFRGWNPVFEKQIDNCLIFKKLFQLSFLKVDHIVVLSSNFTNKLRQWGYEGAVTLSSTVVSEKLLEKENFTKLSVRRHANTNFTILYLGNISKDKGVWEIIKAVKIIRQRNNFKNMKCIIAGDGDELLSLKEYSVSNGLDIEFPGYVRGKQKAEMFKSAHLYVFPSAHEGMPNSVLESMAFGLPIITTMVGGLPDFFEEGKMGFFLTSREPDHIAEKIILLISNQNLMKMMSRYNYCYARDNFYAKKVARHFESIVESVINDR